MLVVARARAPALLATAATIIIIIAIAGFAAISSSAPAFAQVAAKGSRPAYIYDRAGVITPEYHQLIDAYLRGLDDATTDEIVIYTIPSFVGHGIKKDGVEIHDRDMLANYIYNDLTLDGIKGIGKSGKDNGVLVLMSLQRDAGGGSMRIEVGRGLEGNITDGTAGEILDRYLVPARQEYENTGSTAAFGRAFYNTVIALGQRTGYQAGVSADAPADNNNNNDSRPAIDDRTTQTIMYVAFIAIFVVLAAVNAKYGRRGRRRGGYFIGGGYGGGWGGGGGGGGFGGGGGRSGGGGAGR